MSDSKRTEKVQRIVQNYQITKEEAWRIVNTDEDLLTFEELKLKYNNLTMGQLPSWLTEQSLDKMIRSTLRHCLSFSVCMYDDVEDLYQELQLYVRKKSNKLKNYNHLKIMLKNYLIRKVYFNDMSHSHIPHSINESLKNTHNLDTDDELLDVLHEDIDFTDEYENNITDLIKGIKNKQVKDFLIVTGYLLCEIDALGDLYKDVINKSNDSIKLNLKKIEDIKNENNRIVQLKYDNPSCTLRRKVVSISHIIKALELNTVEEEYLVKGDLFNEYETKTKKINPKDMLMELRYYIKNNDILNSKFSLYGRNMNVQES